MLQKLDVNILQLEAGWQSEALAFSPVVYHTESYQLNSSSSETNASQLKPAFAPRDLISYYEIGDGKVFFCCRKTSTLPWSFIVIVLHILYRFKDCR